MSAILNTNYGAVVSRKNLEQNQRFMDKAVERLSSGRKTINARDDAAGIAIAGKMEAQIRGLSKAVQHAKDGQSMAGTAESAMREITTVLQRMRELAVYSASGIANNSGRDHLNLEMSNLVAEIENISTNTEFNQRQVLNGDQFTFYTDIDVAGANITTISANMAANALGVSMNTVSIGGSVPQANLGNVVAAIDNAITTVDSKRANLGAVSNRFDHIIGNLQNVVNNTEKSKSTMIDADYTTETVNLTTSRILQSGSTTMLAQANAQKKLILTLFQQ